MPPPPRVNRLLTDKEYFLAAFTSSQCGINGKKHRKDVPSSSPPLHLLGPLAACWRVPLGKWMECKGLEGGGGFSYWVDTYDS